MIDAPRTSTRMSLPVVLLSLATMSSIACRDVSRITGPRDSGAVLVVSNPTVAMPGTLGAIGAVRSVVGTATAEAAYVSLPPGTISDATSATVRNVTKRAQFTVTVIDGGFDPVEVAADAGDTISVETQGGGGPMMVVVPVRRPPQVIRTYPLHGKRDVPLNSRILLVFSEPLDRQSVNESTVQLLRGGFVVPGHVAVDDMGLTITFVPDTPLLENTDYEIVVTEDVVDFNGEHLPAPVRSPFTTSASSLSVQRIAFFSDRVMYVMNSDGSGIQKLIDGDGTPFSVTHPAWSPDAAKIAFAATRDGNWDIYVMNADGSNVTRLTTDPALDVAPDWSHDGKQIVFTSTRGEGWRDIYVMNADGTNVRRLTNDPASDNNPAWSPDDSKIAFSSDRAGEGGDTEIYSMNADGSGITRLTHDPDPNDMPDWSPDGALIAYHRYEPFGTGAVYIMAANNGAGAKRLTNGGGAPSWSPDGKFIVYSATFLYLMNADGSGARKLTSIQGYEPAWSPR